MINIKKQVKKKDLEIKFLKLFKIPRSILGEGFRKSLKILGSDINLNFVKIRSGTKVLDWTVPNEWNIVDAYILDSNNKKFCEFKKNNLHLVNYSVPIKKIIHYSELKKKLYTLPKVKNAIPYVTSYYKKDWGFCIKHSEFLKLKKNTKYKVFINSSLKPGNLVYSDNLIKGKSKKQVLIYTYLCHPQMANHELSGPLVWSNLYNLLKKTGPHNLTYRFVVAPENIGAAAFLSKNLKSIKKDTKAGYIINCVGYGDEFTLKKSRQGNSISDRAARNILRFKKKFTEVDFFPDGSDERQFCSPGFNLPIALVMRKMFGTFKEYHNSLDNEKFISFETIKQSIETYYDILMTIDNNFIPKAKILYGTPQLSKSKIDLYPKIMTFGTKPKSNRIKIMLEILNRADGSMDLIEIFEKNNLRLIDHIDLIKDLLKSGYIKKLN